MSNLFLEKLMAQGKSIYLCTEGMNIHSELAHNLLVLGQNALPLEDRLYQALHPRSPWELVNDLSPLLSLVSALHQSVGHLWRLWAS